MTGHTVEAGPVRGLLAAIDAALDVPAAASPTDDDLRMLVLNSRIETIRGVIRALDDVDELALRFAAGYIGGHAEPVAYVTYGFRPADDPAEVAEGVEAAECGERSANGRFCAEPDGHTGLHRDVIYWAPPTGHLPQHTHGEGPCTHKGCHDAGHDLPTPTREVPADALAAHAPVGAQ